MASKRFARRHMAAPQKDVAAPEEADEVLSAETAPPESTAPEAETTPAGPPPPPTPPPSSTGANPFSAWSTEALAAAIKALTGIKEFEADKASQAAVEQMAEELKKRPVPVEEQESSKLSTITASFKGYPFSEDLGVIEFSSIHPLEKRASLDFQLLQKVHNKLGLTSGDVFHTRVAGANYLHVHTDLSYKQPTWLPLFTIKTAADGSKEYFVSQRVKNKLAGILPKMTRAEVNSNWKGLTKKAMFDINDTDGDDRCVYCGALLEDAGTSNRPGICNSCHEREMTEEPGDDGPKQASFNLQNKETGARRGYAGEPVSNEVPTYRKCDDCGQHQATATVGGRKVCSTCATQAKGFKQAGAPPQNSDSGEIVEGGDKIPEVNLAHNLTSDDTGVEKPTTELPSKVASTSKAAKDAEKFSENLKKLYLDAKVLTSANQTRPVREAVESIYNAMVLMTEAVKVLNKQQLQEEQEKEAQKIVENKKSKSSGLMGGLKLASQKDDFESED